MTTVPGTAAQAAIGAAARELRLPTIRAEAPRLAEIAVRERHTHLAYLAEVIGTNLPFSEWGTVFPDPRLVAAIVDRVTFNAHILETGAQSCRLRSSTTTTRHKHAI
jgi:hypothetical protein